MRNLMIAAAVLLFGAAAAHAQDAPHFKQDTPPVPGQIVETPRESLRLAPRLYRDVPADTAGLPSSGPAASSPAQGIRHTEPSGPVAR
jgi:hypothetical protein